MPTIFVQYSPAIDTIQTALGSLNRQRERLLSAYLAEAIELTEFERRQRELVQQREALQVQERQLAHYSEQLLKVRTTIPTIQAICQRLQVGLEHATFDQQRELIELLIDCVIVTGAEVEIRYVIPSTESSTHIRFCHLRKDYPRDAQRAVTQVIAVRDQGSPPGPAQRRTP